MVWADNWIVIFLWTSIGFELPGYYSSMAVNGAWKCWCGCVMCLAQAYKMLTNEWPVLSRWWQGATATYFSMKQPYSVYLHSSALYILDVSLSFVPLSGGCFSPLVNVPLKLRFHPEFPHSFFDGLRHRLINIDGMVFMAAMQHYTGRNFKKILHAFPQNSVRHIWYLCKRWVPH